MVEDSHEPVDEVTVLYEEIRALLDVPLGSGGQSLESLEDTLTAGYARALALEAERLRLQRRIGELGAAVHQRPEGSAEELAALAGRLSTASGKLVRLRALLVRLRERIDAVRAARAYGTAAKARR